MKYFNIILTSIALFLIAIFVPADLFGESMAVTAMAAGGVTVSTDADRAVFERTRAFLYSVFGHYDYVITPTDLRLEQPASPNSNTYDFDPYDNNSQLRPMENRLSRNDMFVVTHIGLNITKQDSVADPKQFANKPLYTFPDPIVFADPAAGGNLSEAEALELLYQGKLSFNTSAQKRLENFLTHNCRYVPERTAISAGSPAVITPAQYGPTDEARGYKRIPANMVIDGSQDNKFSLLIGDGNKALIAGAGDPSNIIVLMLKGFRVSGVAFAKAERVPENYRGQL